MINLYQILNLPPNASENEIRTALHNMEIGLNKHTIKAIHEWLLVDDVRQRYNAKLRQFAPEYFAQYAEPEPLPQMPTFSPQKKHNKRIVRRVNGSIKQKINQEYHRADCPALWNPKEACGFTLLFTLCFGALVHALNWSELGEDKLARANFIWALVGAITLIYTTTINTNISILNLLLLITWYFKLGKKQIIYIQTELDSHYQPKRWAMPILMGIAGFFAFLFLTILLSALFRAA